MIERILKKAQDSQRKVGKTLPKQRDQEAIQDDASLFFSVVHFHNIQR